MNTKLFHLLMHFMYKNMICSVHSPCEEKVLCSVTQEFLINNFDLCVCLCSNSYVRLPVHLNLNGCVCFRVCFCRDICLTVCFRMSVHLKGYLLLCFCIFSSSYMFICYFPLFRPSPEWRCFTGGSSELPPGHPAGLCCLERGGPAEVGAAPGHI